jgi:hypothetical protein
MNNFGPTIKDDDEDDLGKEARGREFRSYHRETAENEGRLGTGELRRATVCLEAINQAGQHCYDTSKHFFPGANAIDRDEAFGDRRIKAGGALECRATGVIEKLGPLLTPTCRFLRPCSETCLSIEDS